MEKSEVVVGGIYEIAQKTGNSKYDQFFSAKVIRIDENQVLCEKNSVGLSITIDLIQIHELGKQIGYDATYSTEYQDAKQELERFLHLRQCADDLLDHMEMMQQSDTSSLADQLDNYLRLYLDVNFEAIRAKLDNIKAQSKGVQSDANE